MTTAPRILPAGDQALTVEFADRIDDAINQRVIALADSLEQSPIPGLLECVPTYRSLLVLYDPEVTRGRDLSAALLERARAQTRATTIHRLWRVPMVFGGAAGLDLETLAADKGLSVANLIAAFTAPEYRVHMIGFAPGFAYLGGLPEALHTPRLPKPRQRVEAGAIGIGGQQANINSVPGPSGWRFLGRTPLRLFDPERAEPFLMRAGDRVRFEPIDIATAERLDAAVAAGTTIVEPDIR
ncbi:5-oxoprolinase subunit PxpB [Roseospira marina]|uniref:5-oxoprolinase subunit PxpB n=1 Tax=Roseospira marina TaxID=140057 RepID=A0A5M6IIQ7_9PROT|nr:5-oxoprolinase subunit PxpB [Roseospira marina]KAA5607575.1 5-oxoprolinase subunit PxpB [Roseospira marina]MBB4312233.1 KipI family sensor histidine kinase inhibitor [Roseospira marina]MBB5085751.1 KipI family sensor histidine kinase inhibitor [Roseospira marina]